MSSLFQKLFGNQDDSNRNSQKRNASRVRRLRIEPLECREMLSISVADFDSIKAASAELQPNANISAFTTPIADSGGPAKNVILMIADGMGFNATQLGFINNPDAKELLDSFPVQLAVSTYAINNATYDPAFGYQPSRYWDGTDTSRRTTAGSGTVTTDSEMAITAMITGEKVSSGGLSWDNTKGNDGRLTNIADIARDEFGMKTGAVTTVSVIDATPAAVGVHQRARGVDTQPAILNEMLQNLDVVFGAGDPAGIGQNEGSRITIPTGVWNTLNGDGLIDGISYELLRTKADFQAYADGTKDWADSENDKAVGVFGALTSRYNVYQQDGNKTRYDTLPDLTDMSLAALNILHSSDDGFFVMLEGGGIDWAAHAAQGAGHNNFLAAELDDFFNAVMAVYNWIDDNAMWENTLLIVTADHETGDFSDTGVARSGIHTNALVPLWAVGAGSDLFNDLTVQYDTMAATAWGEINSFDGAYIDNTEIFHVMLDAMRRDALDVPAGYNKHDWEKVESQNLQDYAQWENIDGEMRLIGIHAESAGLSGLLDLSGCTELTSLYASYNDLTELDVSCCTALVYLDVRNNGLTELDLTGLVNLEYLYVDYNQLTELDVSGLVNLWGLGVAGNQLKFSSLPSPETFGYYWYAPQSDVEITTSIDVGQPLDLSSEHEIDGTPTAYTWYYEDGTEVSTDDYAETNGVFKFTGLAVGDAIYCEMTNERFPDLTLRTTPVTVNVVSSTLDIDGDGEYDKYDALLLLRYANNLHMYDIAWADDLLWTNSQRTGDEIADYLKTYFTDILLFDLDGDGVCDKYDALLLLRYANNLHLYDPAWADDLLWKDSQRNGVEIVAYIVSLSPPTAPANAALSIATDTPTYEISGPVVGDLIEGTVTRWEFSAVSSSPIMDWTIDWGDGSEATKILGGPRSRVAETHSFQEAGTYEITVTTTDYDGNATSVIIGMYTVKARKIEPLAVEEEDFTLIEPEADIPEFVLFEGSAIVSFASQIQEESFVAWSLPTNESRFTFTENYLARLAETTRQRQMLDLDRRNSTQTDNAAFTDLIWSDELFDDKWMDFSEQSTETDFWGEVFEAELLTLK